LKLVPGIGPLSTIADGLARLFAWLVGTPSGRITALSVIISLAVLWYGHLRYNEGREAVTTEVNEQNKDANDGSDAYRDAYDRCLSAGGVFDYARGACDR
jgi:hypothetical protein